MKLFSKTSEFKTLGQIFFSITLAISATIFILSAVLHLNYENIASGISTSYAKESLRNISYSATFLHSSADNMMKQLFADPDVQYLMSSKNPSFPNLSKALNQLTAYKSSSNFVKSVYVYNRAANTVFSTLNYGMCQADDFVDSQVLDFIAAPSVYNMQSPVFRQLPVGDYSDVKGSVFTFVLSEMTAQENTGGAVILNLSVDWLRNIVLSLQENSTPGDILIFDEEKNFLELTAPQKPQSELNLLCMDSVLEKGLPRGSFTLNVDDMRYLVAYDTSSATNWVFARITPYTFITNQLDDMRNFTLITSFVVLLCGIAASLILSQRLYTPMHFMSNKIKTLESQNWNKHQLIQHDIYRRLLRGTTAFSDEEWSSAFGSSYALSSDSTVRVLLLKIDNFENFCLAHNPAERSAYRYSLINIASELFEHNDTFAVGVSMEEDHVALLISDGLSGDAVFKVLSETQKNSEKYLCFSFSAAVSEAGELYHDLPLLYTQCQQTINYRLFHGHGAILLYDTLPQPEPKLIAYPTKQENTLIELLVQGKLEEAKKTYKNIISILHTTTFGTFRLMVLKLLTAVYIVEDTIQQSSFSASHSPEIKSLDTLIDGWETIDDINTHFYTLFERICSKSGLKNRLQNEKRHSEIISRMMREIELNYSDKNLSLYSLASLDDMNPVYLGRIFKKAQACSVADYINRIRLNHAKSLLLASDESVADIADTVGFSNGNYFYSVFKKSFGVTPNVYRQCQGSL